jgi:hypothetical protein
LCELLIENALRQRIDNQGFTILIPELQETIEHTLEQNGRAISNRLAKLLARTAVETLTLRLFMKQLSLGDNPTDERRKRIQAMDDSSRKTAHDMVKKYAAEINEIASFFTEGESETKEVKGE